MKGKRIQISWRNKRFTKGNKIENSLITTRQIPANGTVLALSGAGGFGAVEYI